jgi:hypothetical protein
MSGILSLSSLGLDFLKDFASRYFGVSKDRIHVEYRSNSVALYSSTSLDVGRLGFMLSTELTPSFTSYGGDGVGYVSASTAIYLDGIPVGESTCSLGSVFGHFFNSVCNLYASDAYDSVVFNYLEFSIF